MEDENKLGQILIEEEFKKQNGSAAIQPAIAGAPGNYRYSGLTSLLDPNLDDEFEELVIQITKIKGSNVYNCDFYKKK